MTWNNDWREYDLSYQADQIVNMEAIEEPDPNDPDSLVAPTLDQFEEQEVDWLIDGYIPRKQITIMCGDGGVGKTSVWASITADLSAGRPTIFDVLKDIVPQREPMHVIFFSAEDTVEQVIKKKLRQANANMQNIRTISLASEDFDKIYFGSPYLESLYRKYKPDLVIYDPIQSFVGEKIKMSDRNALRAKTRPLIEWGAQYGAASLLLMHSNKQSNVWGRQRMADSADLWDISRSVIMVGNTGEDDLKYLSHEKSNYGKTSKTILFNNSSGLPVVYATTEKKDKDFVLEASKRKNEENSGSTLQDVCNFILTELADHKEGMIASDLDSLLLNLGYKRYLIVKAKKELKDGKLIKYVKPKEMGGNWVIKLP